MAIHRRSLLLGGSGLAAAALALPDDVALTQRTADPRPLPVPDGTIDVAFLVSAGSNVIDMAGPWEVFQDVARRPGFRLFTVAATADPVRLTAGLQVIPDYAVDKAPQPHVVVVPAMRGSPQVHAWLKAVSTKTDLTMSVCTGAFQLARAGLLSGKPATTHHQFYDAFARDFPDVKLQRGFRFVETSGNVATAGGLTSGIDLALRTVERYFGRAVAQQTADYMEYKSTGWIA